MSLASADLKGSAHHEKRASRKCRGNLVVAPLPADAVRKRGDHKVAPTAGDVRGRRFGGADTLVTSHVGDLHCSMASQFLVTKQIPPAVLSWLHSWSASSRDSKGPS